MQTAHSHAAQPAHEEVELFTWLQDDIRVVQKLCTTCSFVQTNLARVCRVSEWHLSWPHLVAA